MSSSFFLFLSQGLCRRATTTDRTTSSRRSWGRRNGCCSPHISSPTWPSTRPSMYTTTRVSWTGKHTAPMPYRPRNTSRGSAASCRRRSPLTSGTLSQYYWVVLVSFVPRLTSGTLYSYIVKGFIYPFPFHYIDILKQGVCRE